VVNILVFSGKKFIDYRIRKVKTMSRYIGRYILIILLALLLGACGGTASTPEPGAVGEETAPEETAPEETEEEAAEGATDETAAEEVAPEKGSLIGSAWQLDFFGEPENPVPALEGTRPTFNILIERYAGFGGCNMYMAGFVAGGPDELRLNAPVTTMSTCDEPEGVMSQESSFIGAMANTVAARLDGENLALYTVGDQRLMTLAPAEPIDMEAATWQLQFMSDGEDLAPLELDTEITAQFADGAISGSAGCNEYSGTVQMDDSSATISDVAATEMACEEPKGVMDQETEYLSVLQAVAGYDLVGSTLLLLDGDGEPILLFNGQ